MRAKPRDLGLPFNCRHGTISVNSLGGRCGCCSAKLSSISIPFALEIVALAIWIQKVLVSRFVR